MNTDDNQPSDFELEMAAIPLASLSELLTERIVRSLAEDSAVDERAIRALEANLAALAPASPSDALVARMLFALEESVAPEESAVEESTASEMGRLVEFPAAPAVRRYRQAGQLAAVAALLALSVFLISYLVNDLSSPPSAFPGGDNGFAKRDDPGTRVDPPAPGPRGNSRGNLLPAGFGNDVVDSRSEGFIRGDDNRIYRKIVREFMDTFEWRDPETGRSLRIQKPRQQIVLIPVEDPL